VGDAGAVGGAPVLLAGVAAGGCWLAAGDGVATAVGEAGTCAVAVAVGTRTVAVEEGGPLGVPVDTGDGL